MILSMLNEEKRINEKIEEEKHHIDKINSLYQFIEDCETKISTGDVDIKDVIEMFKIIKKDYYNEYKIYNLSDLSLPLLIPVINEYYANWNPFVNEDTRSLCYDIFNQLKNLLEDSNSLVISNKLNSFMRQQHQQIDSYYRLIWEAWMPSVRKSLLNYNIKNCNSVIDFIELWMPLLPQWIIENILEQLIMPKLTQEVENWNPLIDTVPIHAWIHPWLPLMKTSLDPLYAPIRFKLSNALSNWHPSDNSAKAILLPWKNVFSTTSWDLFMINNILPKLEKCLNEFEINPRQQNVEPWKWIMSWEDLIPTANFVTLIDKSFFSKWLQVLSIWLNSNPNYEEISRWYVGWKTLFSDKLLNNSFIKSKLSQGLMMMNKSANGDVVSYTPQQQTTPGIIPSQLSSNLLESIQTTSTPSIVNFKDIIEKKAAEHNLLFLPLSNRFYQGKQIYRLGNINVYVDRNVIFHLNNGIWRPSSLDEVIKVAF